MTFGRYLGQYGIVSPAQLEESTRSLVVFGGRLGTHLVEAGVLSLDELEHHLGDHLGVSPAPVERLEKPDPAALGSLPLELVDRHKVFPFRCGDSVLHVAMRDPRNRRLVGELTRAAGRRIVAYLVSELRLFFLLEKHFGIHRNERYARTTPSGDGGPREILLDEELAPGDDLSDCIRPLGPGEELIDPEAFASLYQDRFEGELATEDPTCASLEGASDRNGVAAAALRDALGHARAAALFLVRGSIRGIAAAGDVHGKDIRGILVEPRQGSLLADAIRSGAPRRGPLRSGIDTHLVHHLRPGGPRELAFLPIHIQQRVVNVLYADHGPEPFDDSSWASLVSLCERVAASYERIILEHKRHLV
jgi:hypothetical protein